MSDFNKYGPPAWAEKHGNLAIEALTALIELDDARTSDHTLDIKPMLKDIAKQIDGEFVEGGAYPYIFLASRGTLLLGNIGNKQQRKTLENCRKLIRARRFHANPSYSSSHELALYLLYHLRIVGMARAGGLVARASKLKPHMIETHILADSFAAAMLTHGYSDEDGKIRRDTFNNEHHELRRAFNMIECHYANDQFKVTEGVIEITENYPAIMIESLINAPVSKVSDHYLMQNDAKVVSIEVSPKGTSMRTNSRSTRNFKAFAYTA